jgi:hypothetical protein
MVYKPKKSHLVLDALSRLSTSDEPNGVLDQVIDAPLFLLQSTSLQKIHDYLQIKDFPISYTLE